MLWTTPSAERIGSSWVIKLREASREVGQRADDQLTTSERLALLFFAAVRGDISAPRSRLRPVMHGPPGAGTTLHVCLPLAASGSLAILKDHLRRVRPRDLVQSAEPRSALSGVPPRTALVHHYGPVTVVRAGGSHSAPPAIHPPSGATSAAQSSTRRPSAPTAESPSGPTSSSPFPARCGRSGRSIGQLGRAEHFQRLACP
jgi:hypothetical protein